MSKIHSKADILRCLDRELEMRKRVYPKRVIMRQMTQHNADQEISTLEATRNLISYLTRNEVETLQLEYSKSLDQPKLF